MANVPLHVAKSIYENALAEEREWNREVERKRAAYERAVEARVHAQSTVADARGELYLAFNENPDAFKDYIDEVSERSVQ